MHFSPSCLGKYSFSRVVNVITTYPAVGTEWEPFLHKCWCWGLGSWVLSSRLISNGSQRQSGLSYTHKTYFLKGLAVQPRHANPPFPSIFPSPTGSVREGHLSLSRCSHIHEEQAIFSFLILIHLSSKVYISCTFNSMINSNKNYKFNNTT